MPRRQKRELEETGVEEIARRVLGPRRTQREGFVVQRSMKSEKSYSCPYCNGPIKSGEAHLVAYPSERLDERRHYHAGCWSKVSR